MDTIRHGYRFKWWAQAWYLAWGILFIGLSVHLFSATVIDSNGSTFKALPSLLLPAGFLAVGCYFLALALRSRVVLEATRITVRYAIREKSADLSEITGWQTYARRNLSFLQLQFRGISFWHLRLKGSGSYISIMQLFNVDDYFQSWLRQLPDLDNLSLSL